MSPDGAYAEGSIPFALADLARPPFGAHAWLPPCQDRQCRCLFKATDHTPSRTPSVGLMLGLAARAGLNRLLVIHVRALAPSTRSGAADMLPFVEEGAAASPYPAPSWCASRPTSTTPGGCLSPTSATNITTRAPDDRSTPELAVFAATTTSTQRLRGACLKAPNTCGSAAPDHLSAIQPRVARRLTPSHKLRSALFTRLLRVVSLRKTRAPLQGAASPRRFQPPSKLTTRPLTLPVAPRGRPDEPNGETKSQDRFHRPCVNKSGFPGPERLPSTCAPPTFAGSARHRSRSFAAAIRLPALVRLPDALAREG